MCLPTTTKQLSATRQQNKKKNKLEKMPSCTKIVTSQIRYVAGSSEDIMVKLQTDLSIILYTDLILPLSIAF